MAPKDDSTTGVGGIGKRIRALRKQVDRSLTSVAEQVGISVSAMSQIENGTMQPSVSRLVEIMTALEIPLSAVFLSSSISFEDFSAHDTPELSEPLTGVSVAHRGDADPLLLSDGVVYERLTPRAVESAQFFRSTYPPSSSSSEDGEFMVHQGFETGYVVEGELAFLFEDGEVTLAAGDSISFAAERPHRVVNRSTSQPAVSIWLTVTGI